MAYWRSARFWVLFIVGWLITVMFLGLMARYFGSPDDMTANEMRVLWISIYLLGALSGFSFARTRTQPEKARGFEVIQKPNQDLTAMGASHTDISDVAVVPASRGRRWPRRAFMVACAVLVLLFLFLCSGLPFPLLFARHSLTALVRNDFQLALPANTAIEHASYIATRDPAECFQLRLPPSAVRLFIARLESAARARSYSIDTDTPATFWTMGPTPGWWHPTLLSDVRRLDITIEPIAPGIGSATGYICFYSLKSGQIYLFWFST